MAIAVILVLALPSASCASEPSDVASIQPDPAPTASTAPVTTSRVDDALPEGSTDPNVTDDGQEGAGETGEQELPVTTNPPKSSPEPGLPPTSVEPLPEGPVASAVADLAARLGVAVSAVAVVSQEEVTWPNAAIGCPHPDMAYAQVLVNGSLLVLSVDGTDFQYHSGGGRGPFYCPNPTAPTSSEYGDV